MHTAPSVATAHKATHLTIKWVELVQDLRALGVAVRYGSDVPDETVGEIDEDGTLWVRTGAPFEDQIWLMQQCWNYLAIGPHASPSAQVVPRLRLVLPEQRTDEPAEPAV